MLRQLSIDGRIDESLLDGAITPNSWSPDGRYIAFTRRGVAGSLDVWALPLDGDRTPIPIANSAALERSAAFSPDGRAVAFTSDELGSVDVYVQPFAGPGLKRRVSRVSGSYPQWRGDGCELFF